MHGPLPIKTTPTAQPYWDALARDEIRLQRCTACGTWVYYPRSRCSACLSAALEWRQVEPVGSIHTFTVTHRPTAPMFSDQVPQVIAIVALDVGVHVTTTLIVDDPATVHVGQRVTAVFDHTAGDTTLLRFTPVS